MGRLLYPQGKWKTKDMQNLSGVGGGGGGADTVHYGRKANGEFCLLNEWMKVVKKVICFEQSRKMSPEQARDLKASAVLSCSSFPYANPPPPPLLRERVCLHDFMTILTGMNFHV